MLQSSSSCECNDYSLLTANTGIAQITTANPNALNGAGSTTVITAAANGTKIESLIVKFYAPVTALTVLRFFVGSGTSYSLIEEYEVPIYPDLVTTPTPAPVYPTMEI